MMTQAFLRNERSNYYVEKPSATFCNGKYSILDDFCYAKFLEHDTLVRRVTISQMN